MQKKKSVLRIGIIGFFTVLATLSSFFVFLPKERFRSGSPLGYFFVILAEVLFFFGLILIEIIAKKTEQVMMRGGAISVLCIETVVSVVISEVWIYFRCFSARSFISIQFVLMLIAIIFNLLIYFSSNSVKKSNIETMQAVNTIQNMKYELEVIKRTYFEKEAPFSKYAIELQSAIEELQFSDISALVEEDTLLLKKIARFKTELKDESISEERIKEILSEIKLSIEIRKLQTKNQKLGRI